MYCVLYNRKMNNPRTGKMNIPRTGKMNNPRTGKITLAHNNLLMIFLYVYCIEGKSFTEKT